MMVAGAVEDDRTSDDSSVTGKLRLPNSVRQERDSRGADLVFTAKEAAAEHWLDTEHVEEIPRGLGSGDDDCPVRAEQVAGPVIAGQVREDVVPSAAVEIIRVGCL